MTAHAVMTIALYFAVLVALAVPLGRFVARVLEGRPTWAGRVLGPLERLAYRLAGVRADEETGWLAYAGGMLLFNAAGLVAVYALQRLQAVLPLDPQRLPAVTPHLAFDIAVSFVTNTDWQGYAGETTLGHLVQMAGLTVQNFVSAATGIAVLGALVRGLARRPAAGAGAIAKVGNFWVDLTRATLYVLLPLALAFALVLAGQGVVQTLAPARTVTLVERTIDAHGAPVTEQRIAVGPVASQVAIKQLGTNGGGFFNANSAHPLENPTPLSNFLELLAVLLLPAALCFTFGEMVEDRRQGWAVFAAMALLFVLFLVPCVVVEQAGNPALRALGVDDRAGPMQPGGNMEGKEARFGVATSALWAAATTAASNGSVDSMHDSFMPLGGMMPMALIQLGEVVFGGVGSGLYGMLVFVIAAVFIAGLMVGRTPEYLGKKIEAFEMKMASLIILVPPLLVELGAALGVSTAAGRAGPANPGPHAFSEILYAFSSAANNNGSAFAGLAAGTPFYDLSLAFAMLIGRYWLAVPVLALAGSLAAKKKVPVGPGTLPTHTPLFVLLVVATVLIVGALALFPALALGPVAEHLQVVARR